MTIQMTVFYESTYKMINENLQHTLVHTKRTSIDAARHAGHVLKLINS